MRYDVYSIMTKQQLITTILFLATLGLLVFVIYAAYGSLDRNDTPIYQYQPQPPMVFEEVRPAGVGQPAQIEVPTRDGGMVVVTDVRDLPATVTFDDQNYLFAESVAGEGSFQILFQTIDGSYLLSLESEPLREARAKGEAALLGTLGVTKDEACQLKIRVGTSFDVNELYGAKDVGLSFCPGSIEL